MDYVQYRPGNALAAFVGELWSVRTHDLQPGVGGVYYSTADVLTKIVFAFRTGRDGAAFVFSGLQGQTRNPDRLAPTPMCNEMIGVALYPQAVPLLFGTSAGELSEHLLALGEVERHSLDELHEQLCCAPDTQHRIDLLRVWLGSRLAGRQPGNAVAFDAQRYIRARNGNVSLPALSDRYGISPKQFERIFRQHAGFLPKLYARIVRFEHALGHLPYAQSLTDLACASGYYDQSHFIRDFRAFSGFSPREYALLHD